MATTKGAAIAAPQIFGSDPLEQQFAKGVIGGDPGQSGIAGALMLAAGLNRERHQDTYLTALAESNRMASLLEKQNQAAETQREALKMGPAYANAGIDPTTVPLIGQLYNDPSAPLARLPSGLHNQKTMAEIAKLNADSAAKYGEGGPKIEMTQANDVYGSGQINIKVKGGTIQQQIDLQNKAAQALAASRGQQFDPNAPLKRPGSVTPGAGPSARIHNNID